MKTVTKLIVVTLLVLSTTLNAGESKGPWTINLEAVDIGVFIAQMADITGKTVVISPKVKGKVTVVSQTPLDKLAVKELFLSVLGVHGFTAVPSGSVLKIIPMTTAKGSNIRFDKDGTYKGEELSTRVIPIENAPASELVKILRPMVSKSAHLAAVSSVNAIIVSDHANNIARLEQVIARIEMAEEELLKVVQLKHAWVDDVVDVIQKLMLTKEKKKRPPFHVVADKRNNRIVFKGEAHEWEEVSGLILKLDKPSDNNTAARVVYLQHAVANEIADILNNIVANKNDAKAKQTNSEIRISADESLNAIVVRASPSTMEEVINVVKRLDIPRAQVLIEAAIVEISAQNGRALGVQIAAGDTSKRGEGSVPIMGTNLGGGNIISLNQIAAMLADPTSAALGSGLTIGAGKATKDGKFKYGALLQALESSANSNLLSTPSVLTLDNQEAEIIVGQNVPFRTGSTTSGSSGTANPFTTIKRQDIGVTLKVKPRINAGDIIRMEIEQTTESINQEVSIGNAGSADIVTNKRSIKTVINAHDGEVIVLGGLISDDVVVTHSKVPLLGDIPFLGALFRSTSRDKVKRNLMVFLRPSIVRDMETAAEIRDSRFDVLYDLLGPDLRKTKPTLEEVFTGKKRL